jgi:hypothetical protein
MYPQGCGGSSPFFGTILLLLLEVRSQGFDAPPQVESSLGLCQTTTPNQRLTPPALRFACLARSALISCSIALDPDRGSRVMWHGSMVTRALS